MLEKRQTEAARIRKKHPDRIPVRFLLDNQDYKSILIMIGFMYLCNVLIWEKCWLQVIVEKANRSDIPSIDKKKLVSPAFFVQTSFLCFTCMWLGSSLIFILYFD